MSRDLADNLRRVLACLSLANLLALQMWVGLFRPAQLPPMPGASFAGGVAAVLVFAVALWAVSQLPGIAIRSDKWRQTIRLGGLTLIWFLIIWGAMKPFIFHELQQMVAVLPKKVLIAFGMVLLIVGMIPLVRYATRFINVMTTLAIVLSPFAVFNIARATFETSQRGLSPIDTPIVQIPTLNSGEHRLRTVVVIFDEFDYQLAFDPTVRRNALPLLDDLRSRGFFATQAYSPMHSTAQSVPAMLTGRLVRKSSLSDKHPGDHEILFDDGLSGLWSDQNTLFTDLRAKGMTSLRLNQALLSPIKLDGPADADIVIPPRLPHLVSVSDYAASNLVAFVTRIPLISGTALEVRLNHLLGLPQYSVGVSQVASQIVDLVGDAQSDVLFLHILLPHLPVVFIPDKGYFGDATSTDYRDNLLGADHVMSQILHRLRERGRLADTNLIITSDHFFRLKRTHFGLGDHRIPFIAIFAGDESPYGDFHKPFNTILFRRVIGEIVTGRIQTSSALARWFDEHATFGESPLTEYRKGW